MGNSLPRGTTPGPLKMVRAVPSGVRVKTANSSGGLSQRLWESVISPLSERRYSPSHCLAGRAAVPESRLIETMLHPALPLSYGYARERQSSLQAYDERTIGDDTQFPLEGYEPLLSFLAERGLHRFTSELC
jgi:hypothetical protein